jgi:hypothetical protein
MAVQPADHEPFRRRGRCRRPTPLEDEAAERVQSTPVPRAIRAAPGTTTAVAGFEDRQPVSSYGIRPATTPGATRRNRTLPNAA